MSLTIIIVIATVLISLQGWKNNDFQRKWMFNPYSIDQHRQYYRFISSGFIHADQIHLFFNMFVLYMFGEQIEDVFTFVYGISGKFIFIGLYLAAIIISSIPSYIKFRHAAYYNSLGASGGTSALLFSYVIFDPTGGLCLFGISMLCLPGFLWLILYLIYSYFKGKQGTDNINHDAHIFGGVFGMAFTLLLFPELGPAFIEKIISYRMF